MNLIEKLSHAKAQQTGQDEEEWLEAVLFAFKECSLRDLGETNLELLIRDCPTPEHLQVVSLLFNQNCNPEEGFQAMAESIDETNYGLADWLDSFYEMSLWLTFKKKKADFKDIVGYIRCCAMAVENDPTHPELAVVLQEMLRTQGFEAARKC